MRVRTVRHDSSPGRRRRRSRLRRCGPGCGWCRIGSGTARRMTRGGKRRRLAGGVNMRVAATHPIGRERAGVTAPGAAVLRHAGPCGGRRHREAGDGASRSSFRALPLRTVSVGGPGQSGRNGRGVCMDRRWAGGIVGMGCTTRGHRDGLHRQHDRRPRRGSAHGARHGCVAPPGQRPRGGARPACRGGSGRAAARGARLARAREPRGDRALFPAAGARR